MELSPPTADMVYHNICALFHNNNPKEKEGANKWLDEFQKSIYSWSIADELLQQKRDLHSCYFAAQTMRNKIQNSFNEIPPTSHASLRESLIGHVTQITPQTDSVIVTQLCLAVADLILLMASWKSPITDLIDMLSTQPESIWPLLDILTLVPEEIDSRYLRLGANRRQEIHKQMDSSAPKVLQFLCACLQHSTGSGSGGGGNNNDLILNATLRCYSAWISIQAIPMYNFADNPLAQHVFYLLSLGDTSRKLHDTSTDCVCALLSCLDEAASSATFSSHQMQQEQTNGIASNNAARVPPPALDPMLELQLFNAVCSLESAYHTSVANEDIDKTMNYCRIFTVLCDAFFMEVLSNDTVPHYSIKGFNLVLMCVGHFDYEVAEITFNLWYRLSEDLFQRNNDKLTAHFRPYIERLLAALFRHAQIEADHEGLIEESDSFYDFRRKVSDLIKDVAFIVGSGACFKQMFLTLQEPGTTWESTESALFIMQNVAKNIIPNENEVVPKVVEAILNLPENTHIAVRYTSIMLLGELCDWIENHPESLEAVLNFLLSGLQQRNGLAGAAAIALTSICSACRQKMVCHINGLVAIARSLDVFEISNDLAINLLKGISLILSRLPLPQLTSAMREIISFQLQQLVQLVESPNATFTSIRKGECSDPAYWIDRVCSVVRHTNPDIDDRDVHPTLHVLTDSWPLLSQVIAKYQADVRIMERTCRLIRYGVRMVRKQAYMLVEPLVKQMVCVYTVHHHSCFLYLGSVLVDEFAKTDKCIEGLLEMLKAFIEPTFGMLQLENGLRNNPDTVDDFFRLCSRFIECCPLPFLQSALVTPIFQCALLACTLDHREANSSVMKFFSNLLKWGRSGNTRLPECRPLVNEIAKQNGEALVLNLIHASVFCLHSYMLHDVAEVLIELKSAVTHTEMEAFLRAALEALPKRNSAGYVNATPQQLEEFSAAVLRADTIKATNATLKLFTRLFR